MAQVAHDETRAGDAARAANEPAPPVAAGPGLGKLEELLARGQQPKPEEVVELIDAHRGEQDAMLAALQRTFGNAYVAEVAAFMDDETRWHWKRREVVHGDPTSADGGFFIAGEAERGARWRTDGGGHTGSIGKGGLATRTEVDDDTAIHAGIDPGKRSATVGLEEDGKVVGEAFGRYKDGDDWAVGARSAALDAGDGAKVTPEVRHVVGEHGATDELAASYDSGRGTTAEAMVGRHESGELVGSLSGSHQLDPATTVTGSLGHSTVESAASLGLAHKLDDRTTLTGSLGTSTAESAASFAATHKLSDELTLSGSLGHTHSHTGGGDQTTLALSERYRSRDLIHGVDVTAGAGARDYLSVSATADAAVGPRLFAGGFGGATVEDGKEMTGHAGASLTFTPHEKAALTLAGIVDQDGRLETRLQMDIFKKKLTGLDSFADHKKDALISLFLSYQPDGPGPRPLDDRFGGSMMETGVGGGSQFTGGIRFRF